MDFQQLLAKMVELDQPATESQIKEGPNEECGSPMGMPPPMGKPDTPPPSMSVNINAQGLDDIGQLMQLISKLKDNDDGKASMPMGMPPLKMLPNFGPEPMDADDGPIIGMDMDSDDGPMDIDSDDGPMDMDSDDSPMDMDSDDNEKEGFVNAPDEEYKDVDYMVNKLAGGMNKPKQSFSGKPYRGDNPMAAGAYESKDALRASIRSELQQRLAEAKSEKFNPLKHVKNPTKGEKDAAKDVKRGSYADRADMLKSADADGRLKGAK
jgi:hypothetical protein